MATLVTLFTSDDVNFIYDHRQELLIADDVIEHYPKTAFWQYLKAHRQMCIQKQLTYSITQTTKENLDDSKDAA